MILQQTLLARTACLELYFLYYVDIILQPHEVAYIAMARFWQAGVVCAKPTKYEVLLLL
jgi:hypothetical protein